jgi:hypothetical protein
MGTRLVAHRKMTVQLGINRDTHRLVACGNPIGSANRIVRLEKTETVLELDLESILPAQVTGVPDQ